MAIPRFQGIPVPSNASPELAAVIQDIERWVLDRDREPRALPSFTVAQLALYPAADWPDCAVIVSNETGGRTIATSDATNWCRVRDGATAS